MLRTGSRRAYLSQWVVLAVMMSLPACGGGGNSSSQASAAGAIPVRGTETLAWDQEGDVSDLRFVAYVDNRRVGLDGATCSAAQAGPQGVLCQSPVPALTEGVHTIELAAVSISTGLESSRSAPPLIVQKGAGLTTGSGAVIAPSTVQATERRSVVDSVTAADGVTLEVRVVASGLDAPSQVAWSPDGRLFVAEARGQVLVLGINDATRPDPTLALDGGALLDPAPGGSLGLALHPAFARNRLAYVGYVARTGRARAALRIVRLRDAGGTLGEPAVLFEQTLDSPPRDGPRLAFGPDGLLYVALPQALEPTGSVADPGSAQGSVLLRLNDEGRVTGGSPVYAAGSERLMAFAWEPETRGLWGVFAGGLRRLPAGRAAVIAWDAASAGVAGGQQRDANNTAVDVGRAVTPGALLFVRGGAQPAAPPTAFVALPENDSLRRVTLSSPPRTEALLEHALGRIGDIVEGDDGVLFISTRNRDGLGTAAADDDLIVQLIPRGR